MPAPRVYKANAVVLRQRRLGDVDKIVTLFTQDQGKLDAVAKGVRRTKSRLAGHVEPLSLGSFLLAKGRNLDIVTQVETIDTFRAVRADLRRLGRALFAAELVDRFMQEREASHEVFDLLVECLRRFRDDDALDTVLHAFEMRFLALAGFQPELSECVSCRQPLAPPRNFWHPIGGGCLCPACISDHEMANPLGLPAQPISWEALNFMRLLQTRALAEIEALGAPSPTLSREIDSRLREYLRSTLERDLRSSAFLDSVRRSEDPNGTNSSGYQRPRPL